MAACTRNAHTKEQREFIVRRLAAFVPPRAIVAEFAAVFSDTACNENDVLATDPRLAVVSPDLFVLFRQERDRVLDDPESAEYAAKAARLIALSKQAAFYQSNNQFPEMRTVLRHIAEETGDIVAGGKPQKPGKDTPVAGPPVASITRTIIDPVAPVTA